MGVRIEEKEDGLVIEGGKKRELKAAKVYSHDDHRLAMHFRKLKLNSDIACSF